MRRLSSNSSRNSLLSQPVLSAMPCVLESFKSQLPWMPNEPGVAKMYSKYSNSTLCRCNSVGGAKKPLVVVIYLSMLATISARLSWRDALLVFQDQNWKSTRSCVITGQKNSLSKRRRNSMSLQSKSRRIATSNAISYLFSFILLINSLGIKHVI